MVVSCTQKKEAVAGCHGSRGKLNLDWEYNHQDRDSKYGKEFKPARGVFQLENRKSKEMTAILDYLRGHRLTEGKYMIQIIPKGFVSGNYIMVMEASFPLNDKNI